MERSAINFSDSELIARSFDEPEIFGELFDRHATTIAKYFGRRVDRDQVEVLLSEVFITAFEVRQAYSADKSNALPWLYGIAHNHLRHYYRSHRREHAAVSRLQSSDGSGELQSSSFEDELVLSLDADDDIRRVMMFVGQQSEIDQEVLLLYAWEELSYQQIGEALSIPIGTVRSRLNRIRKKIRELDGQHGQLPNRSGNHIRRSSQSTVSYQTQESQHE